MERTQSKTLVGGRVLYICKVCGKEGQHTGIRNHIEANHIEGIAIPCNHCEKTFRSRKAQEHHKYNYHKWMFELFARQLWFFLFSLDHVFCFSFHTHIFMCVWKFMKEYGSLWKCMKVYVSYFQEQKQPVHAQFKATFYHVVCNNVNLFERGQNKIKHFKQNKAK